MPYKIREHQPNPILIKNFHRNATAIKRARIRKDENFYNNLRWRNKRRYFLMKNKLCSDPFHIHGNRIVFANEVDHIIPRRVRPDLAWNESNLQPLCKSCHSKKTRKEIDEGAL